MPKASDVMAMRVRDGLRRSWRAAKRRFRGRVVRERKVRNSRLCCCNSVELPN